MLNYCCLFHKCDVSLIPYCKTTLELATTFNCLESRSPNASSTELTSNSVNTLHYLNLMFILYCCFCERVNKTLIYMLFIWNMRIVLVNLINSRYSRTCCIFSRACKDNNFWTQWRKKLLYIAYTLSFNFAYQGDRKISRSRKLECFIFNGLSLRIYGEWVAGNRFQGIPI